MTDSDKFFPDTKFSIHEKGDRGFFVLRWSDFRMSEFYPSSDLAASAIALGIVHWSMNGLGVIPLDSEKGA